MGRCGRRWGGSPENTCTPRAGLYAPERVEGLFCEADTTEAWQRALRERVEEVECDTPEAFRARRRLVKLLVQSIFAGKRPDDGRTEIQVMYRFGPPPTSEVGPDQSSVESLKKRQGVLYTNHKRTHSHGHRCKMAQTRRLLHIGSFYGLEGQSGYACTCRSKVEIK